MLDATDGSYRMARPRFWKARRYLYSIRIDSRLSHTVVYYFPIPYLGVAGLGEIPGFALSPNFARCFFTGLFPCRRAGVGPFRQYPLSS